MAYQQLPEVLPNEAIESDWGNQIRENFGILLPDDGIISAWNPTLAGTTTNPTLGSGGSAAGQYTIIAGWCFYWARWRFGTSGVNPGSGVYQFALPAAPHAGLILSGTTYEGSTIGHGGFRDNSATANSRACRVQASPGPIGVFHSVDAVAFWSDSVPVTWAANDRISISGAYPIA